MGMEERARSGAADIVTMSAAFSRPGIDPRDWVSEGTVEDKDAVQFEEGVPYVNVVLQPSKLSVRCRVLMQSAGKGEGEWVPFVSGDQVLVAMPAGDTKRCIIVGRLNNSIDTLPMKSVAGQDPTKNNFAFKRTRTAFMHEVAGGWMAREATSGAFLNVSKDGVITLRDGTKGALQISADVFGFQDGEGKKLMQIDLTGKRYTLQVDDALLTLAASQASPNKSAVVAPGSFSVSAAAQPPAEHVVTTEAVINIVINVLGALGAAIPGPILGAALTPVVVGNIAAAAVPLAALSPLPPAVAGAIQAAFAIATQKPPGVVGQGQLLPGVGCVGFLAG